MPKEKLTTACFMLTLEQKDLLTQWGAKDNRSASYVLRQVLDAEATRRTREEAGRQQSNQKPN